MFGLNPRSHFSLLSLMMLMGQADAEGIAPKCQRIKKSEKARKRRLKEKAARRKQRRMN